MSSGRSVVPSLKEPRHKLFGAPSYFADNLTQFVSAHKRLAWLGGWLIGDDSRGPHHEAWPISASVGSGLLTSWFGLVLAFFQLFFFLLAFFFDLGGAKAHESAWSYILP